uniref:Reverse transcriptase domain-containing protein n=1 Tax=Cannabis sativa TaxID=3483 RepID=A0A803P0J9_CANSA
MPKIKFLIDPAGAKITSRDGMAVVVQSYFADIFQTSAIDDEALHATLQAIPPMVTSAMNDELLMPFTSAEVEGALRAMGPDKSPGIDGMSAMFYQNNWEIVGEMVTKVVLQILNEGADATALNHTIITLIPKIKKPQRITDFRPISLCNVISKLVTKVIVGRFKHVLPMVISETQSTFLANRQIQDNILVAFELVHAMKHKEKGRRAWINLIMACLTSNSFSFLLNGEVTGLILPTRGLRQGCPLSPYLFLIVSEGFSRLWQHEERVGNLNGFAITHQAAPISHLFFADDSLLFCQANERSCMAIKRVLDTYHRASGQLLNPDKSVMSFSPNTTLGIQVFFRRQLHMAICECHETYLGLPAFSGRNKKELFSGVKEKIWRLMRKWREQLFSGGAHRGHSPSLTWQGILWGRELLQNGLHWKIGEGRSVLIGRDPWILGHNSFLPIRYDGPANGVVANLITENREWNSQLLQAYFSVVDVERIMTLPLSFFPTLDRLIWHHHNSGQYTVKSGYHIAASMEDASNPSVSTTKSSWWQFFWSLNLPPKLKIFAWRLIHDALPVAKNLICLESCWFSFDWSNATLMTNGDYIIHLSTVHSKAEMELIFCTLWCIWTERNQVVHGGKAKPVISLAGFASRYLGNYFAARQKELPPPTPAVATAPAIHRQVPWIPPISGSYKLNVDAALNVGSNIIGVGAIVRDAAGNVVAALSKPIVGNFASHEMEAKALFHGLNWVLQMQLPIDYIETDALMVSNAIHNPPVAFTAFDDLILDITSLLSFFPRAVVAHVKRSANMAAHGLAKFALKLDEDCVWLESCPPPIYSIVVNDICLNL